MHSTPYDTETVCNNLTLQPSKSMTLLLHLRASTLFYPLLKKRPFCALRKIKPALIASTFALILTACVTNPQWPKSMVVTAPFIDLRTGPGRGYPLTQSVLRGEKIDIVYQRTGYFKVRTAQNVEGWTDAALLLDPKTAKQDSSDGN